MPCQNTALYSKRERNRVAYHVLKALTVVLSVASEPFLFSHYFPCWKLNWYARLDLHKLVHSNVVVVVVSSKQPEEGTDVNEKKVECENKEISGIVNRNR